LLALTNMIDSICAGEHSILTVTASGGNGGPYNYQWSSGANGNSSTVSPINSSTYVVTVTDGCGTPAATATVDVITATVDVIVTAPPVLQVFVSDTAGCKPLTVNYNTSTNNLNSVSWNFGDGSTSTINNTSHTYTAPGVYNVICEVSNYQNCISRVALPGAVRVYENPIARIVQSTEELSILQPIVQFADMSTNSNSRQWDFGDGSTSTMFNIHHTYNDTGNYVIRLVAVNMHGCRDTAYTTLYVKGEFTIYLPDAFTPNNDGINETFRPMGVGIGESDLYIFDRWGLEIFHTYDIEKGWDGKTAGGSIPCQNDVYVYKLLVKDNKNAEHVYIGKVTLVR
jgi:gliding motility-associated-like protein